MKNLSFLTKWRKTEQNPGVGSVTKRQCDVCLIKWPLFQTDYSQIIYKKSVSWKLPGFQTAIMPVIPLTLTKNKASTGVDLSWGWGHASVESDLFRPECS